MVCVEDPETQHALGIATLEDVIEEILNSEIDQEKVRIPQFGCFFSHLNRFRTRTIRCRQCGSRVVAPCLFRRQHRQSQRLHCGALRPTMAARNQSYRRVRCLFDVSVSVCVCLKLHMQRNAVQATPSHSRFRPGLSLRWTLASARRTLTHGLIWANYRWAPLRDPCGGVLRV